MKVFPLISLLTPCYNSASFIHRLLDSVLAQDYPLVEMYVVDDGSTDDTRQVVLGYIPLFGQKGYTLEYVYQVHAGQSEAINKGLKLVHGKFLAWPDSDDCYATTDALSLLVAALEDSDETVSMVRCLPSYVDEAGQPWHGYRLGGFDKEDLFEDCLLWENGFWCLSGGYMVKMELLDRYIPQRTISTALHAGQNWQLMLPLLHGHRCLTLQKQLYEVMIRENSHSRGQYQTSAALLRKNRGFEYVLVRTLENMVQLSQEEKRAYIRKVRRKYRKTNRDLWWESHFPIVQFKQGIKWILRFFHVGIKG